MKVISAVESKFVQQFQNMVRAFEIENGVKFDRVALEYAGADGSTGYDIVLQTPTAEDPEQPA